MSSIDSLLTLHAKKIQPGETVSFILIKEPVTTSIDVASTVLTPSSAAVAKEEAIGKNRNNNGSKRGNQLDFPRVAKFPVSVVRPRFTNASNQIKLVRLYEQDVPEAKDESDDEESSGAMGQSGMTGGDGSARKKKKRKWNSNAPAQRQWVLEPEDEFIHSMALAAYAKETGKKGRSSPLPPKEKILKRYEGIPEFNSSNYVLLSVHPSTGATSIDGSFLAANGVDVRENGQPRGQLALSVTSICGFHTFHQPSNVHTLSMTEAETAITNQRANMTRYMMHGKAGDNSGKVSSSSVSVPGPYYVGAKNPKVGLSRARLLGKLKKTSNGQNDGVDDDDDDVMGDLSFQNRKGGTRARQEILQSLGEGSTVDDDGVMGGANDAFFGGKQSFRGIAQSNSKGGSVAADEDMRRRQRSKRAEDGDAEGAKGTSTYGGMAMADDFYQRDVGAEYEDLDFDANEQFDDDDVDQSEEHVDASGFSGDIEDDDFEEEDDESGGTTEQSGGLSTAAGLKALMARARGEQVGDDGNIAQSIGGVDLKGKKTTAYNREEPGSVTSGAINVGGTSGKNDLPASAVSVDQSSDEEVLSQPRKRARAAGAAELAAAESDPGVDGSGLDEHGNRIISLQAIRREIWLHHGQIKMKRLLKIFNISKKHASHERQNQFRDLVKELCTMKQTVEGNFLVLKQHYANL